MTKSLFRTAALVAALATVGAMAGCSKKEAAPAVAAPATTVTPPPAMAPLPLPPQAKYVRDFYATLEDCAFDWGYAGWCTPVPSGAPELANGGSFFSPNYSNAIRDESQLESRKRALAQGYLQSLDETPSNRARGVSDAPQS
jgi:hypothetical protein